MYNPYRQTTVKAASNILQRGAEKLASMDKSSKTLGARIEEQISKTINSDADIGFTMGYLQNKFQIPGELTITPKVNDDTLMIEKYALLWYDTKGTIIIMDNAASVSDITDELAYVIQSRDADVIDNFLKKFQ
jgi:hypothetical protein